MATEVPFPNRSFYIVSKLPGDERMALTKGDGDKVALQPLVGAFEQLWTTEDHAQEGSVLRHLASGLALTYRTRRYSTPRAGGYETPEGLVHLTPLVPGEVRQVWRAEAVNGWVALNTRLDWERKLNVYRSDPRGDIGVYPWDRGANNECWDLLVENGHVIVADMRYVGQGAVELEYLAGRPGPVMTVDNRAGDTLLTDVRWAPRSYKIERAFVIDEASKRGGLPALGPVFGFHLAAEGAPDRQVLERPIGPMAEGRSDDLELEMVDDPAQVLIEVPPGRIYGYRVVVQYARVIAPFIATLRLGSSVSGRLSGEAVVKGRFFGVNPVSSEIEVQDLTAVGVDGGEGELVGSLTPA
ncbi:hypothetical protein DDF62_17335 [Caulobacter radicis]|uniref:hypothetical protein n=1 Tax=Caulobacter radicis TaxID=2172650 RepID=UPI000D58710B|nr:hypothetical protein [Caulobacter radicis]PVM86817.1 hypothetical protein DDF62_17335 [Caulobacter radicis]